MNMCTVLLVVLCCLATNFAQPDPLVVRTAQGNVRGSFLKTYTGKQFFAFRGVRYAESPAGDYRFKPPVPVRPWGEGVQDATADGSVCPQPNAQAVGPAWSEDCLFLNIYSAELSRSAKRPVMVYFHAGGYATITGSSAWEGPQYLLDKDIVLVTINYRLGALGFVSTGDAVLPGNYGMKDQVEALKWVRQNILVFGGDPSRVTIFGYSAGGASTTLHLLSPMSRGLFHRAIAMSGSLTSGWALNRRPKDLAIRLSRSLGCQTTDSSLILSCLMRHSAQQIVNATQLIKDFELDPIALFAPVVEEGRERESFLPEDPIPLLRCGQFARVPVILGVTRDEFASRGFYVLQDKNLTEKFNQRFQTLAPIEFMYERDGNFSTNVSKDIKQFYLDNQTISNRTKPEFMEIYRDALTTFSVVQTAKLLAEKNSESVYLYVFNYKGRYSHQNFPGTSKPMGIAHHDDLIYLFHISKLFPQFNSTDPEAEMVRVLTTIWTNFASTGVPTLASNRSEWRPLRPRDPAYLSLSPYLEMVPGLPFPRRMALWEQLFPPSGPHQVYH